jgi:phage protein D
LAASNAIGSSDVPDSRTQFLDVKLDGSQIATDIVSVTVTDYDSVVDKAEIVLDDRTGTYTDALCAGSGLVVDMGWTSEHAILFEGDVLWVENSATPNGTRRVKLTALDLASRMFWTKHPHKPYTGKLSDIIKSILSENSAYRIKEGDIKPDPDPEFTETKPLLKRDENDWEFIKRLANEYNARAFVEYNGGASKLYFVALSTLVKSKPQGYLHYCGPFSELIDFSCQRLGTNAETLYQAAVHDPTTGDLVESPAPEAKPPAAPLKPDPSHMADLAKSDPAAGERYKAAFEVAAKATPLPTPQAMGDPLPSDPQAVATRTKFDPTRELGFRGVGTARGTIKLRAKGKVGISGVAPWADSNDWYVHQVTHLIQNGTYLTKFGVTR